MSPFGREPIAYLILMFCSNYDSYFVSFLRYVEKCRDLEICVRGHSRHHSIDCVWFAISLLQ